MNVQRPRLAGDFNSILRTEEYPTRGTALRRGSAAFAAVAVWPNHR